MKIGDKVCYVGPDIEDQNGMNLKRLTKGVIVDADHKLRIYPYVVDFDCEIGKGWPMSEEELDIE